MIAREKTFTYTLIFIILNVIGAVPHIYSKHCIDYLAYFNDLPFFYSILILLSPRD